MLKYLVKRKNHNNMDSDEENLMQSIPHMTPEVNEFQATQIIGKMVKFHVTLLFEPEGWEALQEICLGISGIATNSCTKGWRDFAAELNLNYYEIGCIANYTHEDFSELVIKAFAQDKNATIDKILQAIVNIQRWDVIRKSCKSLEYLYETVVSKQYKHLNKTRLPNKCKSYQEFQNAQKDIHKLILQGPILKASNLPMFFATLPITLKNVKKQRELYCTPNIEDENEKPEIVADIEMHKTESFTALIEKVSDNNDHIIFSEVYEKAEVCPKAEVCQTAEVYETAEVIEEKAVKAEETDKESMKKTTSKYEKIVMLTYAQDGCEYVQDIAAQLRTPRPGKLPIGVLTLSEQRSIAINNPEKFVLDMFPQVDYVLPILTPGYFQSLSRYNTALSNLSDATMDEAFTSLIHDLMCKHYVKNSCLNDKFRCIIPDVYVLCITNDVNFANDPTLSVWVPLSELTTLISVLLRH